MRRIFTAAAILALALTGMWQVEARAYQDSSAKQTVVLTEEDIAYEPEDITVHVGQTIRLENKDPFEHKSRVTRKKADGAPGDIAMQDHLEKPGSTHTFHLDQPGLYEIRCMLHDGMTASIRVVR